MYLFYQTQHMENEQNISCLMLQIFFFIEYRYQYFIILRENIRDIDTVVKNSLRNFTLKIQKIIKGKLMYCTNIV